MSTGFPPQELPGRTTIQSTTVGHTPQQKGIEGTLGHRIRDMDGLNGTIFLVENWPN